MASKYLKIHQYYQLSNENILNTFKLHSSGRIFEIGAGAGLLSKLFPSIDVCEINLEFHKTLKNIANNVYGDFFKIKSSFLDNYDTVIGNLPYKKTVEIIEKLILTNVKVLILLIQNQVALKLVDEKISRIKIYISNFYKVEYLREVSKLYFKPVPQVDGAILKFTKIQPFYETIKLKSVFEIFNYERKTLKVIYNILKKEISYCTHKRPSALTSEEFKRLYLLWS